MNENFVLKSFNWLSKYPFGKFLFSKIVCIKAPYFSSIKPYFTELKPGLCEIRIKNRRGVHNHIKSVHAIAMCNMCELAAGTMIEVTLPSNLRWIPKKMTVEYLNIARTDLKAVCKTSLDADWSKIKECPLTVSIYDENNIETVRAVITMHISQKK